MKIFRGIISIILVAAFLNVLVGKAVHEFFEHHHHEHTCDVKDKTHYHEFVFIHADFICDFHFSTTLVNYNDFELQNVIRHFEQQVKVKYLWFVQNIYLGNLLLRGPPSIK